MLFRSYLYFNSHSLFRADRAVCACVTGPATVHIVGWIDKHRFTENAKPMNFGYGSRVAVAEGDLRSFGEWR